MLHANIVIGAALVYSEKQLTGVHGAALRRKARVLLFAAKQPAGGARHGFFNIVPRRRVLYALVKGHGNIRPQVALYAHGFLRAHKNAASVKI